MVPVPGTSAISKFVSRVLRLVARNELEEERLKALKPYLDALFDKEFKPTTEALDSVRRACGWYPKIEVLKRHALGVDPAKEIAEPCIGIELTAFEGVCDPFQVEVFVVQMTGGRHQRFMDYEQELHDQGWYLAGCVIMSAYARHIQQAKEAELIGPDMPLYFTCDGTWMVNHYDTGITSESCRGHSVSGCLFLVTRRSIPTA